MQKGNAFLESIVHSPYCHTLSSDRMLNVPGLSFAVPSHTFPSFFWIDLVSNTQQIVSRIVLGFFYQSIVYLVCLWGLYLFSQQDVISDGINCIKLTLHSGF